MTANLKTMNNSLQKIIKSQSVICAAKTCFNSSRCQPNLSFFCFPSDEKIARIWAINADRENIISKPCNSEEYFLCAEHFDDACFESKCTKTEFKKDGNAIPTIFKDNFITTRTKRFNCISNERVLKNGGESIIIPNNSYSNDCATDLSVYKTPPNRKRKRIRDEEYCRLCADLFPIEVLMSICSNEGIKYGEMIRKFLPEQENYNLPRVICENCKYKLVNCYKVIKGFQDAYDRLKMCCKDIKECDEILDQKKYIRLSNRDTRSKSFEISSDEECANYKTDVEHSDLEMETMSVQSNCNRSLIQSTELETLNDSPVDNQLLKGRNDDETEIKYQCSLCNNLLIDKQDAIYHTLQKHPMERDKIICRVVRVIKIKEKPKTKIKYQCTICTTLLNSRKDLIDHSLVTHPEKKDKIDCRIVRVVDSSIFINSAPSEQIEESITCADVSECNNLTNNKNEYTDTETESLINDSSKSENMQAEEVYESTVAHEETVETTQNEEKINETDSDKVLNDISKEIICYNKKEILLSKEIPQEEKMTEIQYQCTVSNVLLNITEEVLNSLAIDLKEDPDETKVKMVLTDKIKCDNKQKRIVECSTENAIQVLEENDFEHFCDTKIENGHDLDADITGNFQNEVVIESVENNLSEYNLLDSSAEHSNVLIHEENETAISCDTAECNLNSIEQIAQLSTEQDTTDYGYGNTRIIKDKQNIIELSYQSAISDCELDTNDQSNTEIFNIIEDEKFQDKETIESCDNTECKNVTENNQGYTVTTQVNKQQQANKFEKFQENRQNTERYNLLRKQQNVFTSLEENRNTLESENVETKNVKDNQIEYMENLQCNTLQTNVDLNLPIENPNLFNFETIQQDEEIETEIIYENMEFQNLLDSSEVCNDSINERDCQSIDINNCPIVMVNDNKDSAQSDIVQDEILSSEKLDDYSLESFLLTKNDNIDATTEHPDASITAFNIQDMNIEPAVNTKEADLLKESLTESQDQSALDSVDENTFLFDNTVPLFLSEQSLTNVIKNVNYDNINNSTHPILVKRLSKQPTLPIHLTEKPGNIIVEANGCMRIRNSNHLEVGNQLSFNFERQLLEEKKKVYYTPKNNFITGVINTSQTQDTEQKYDINNSIVDVIKREDGSKKNKINVLNKYHDKVHKTDQVHEIYDEKNNVDNSIITKGRTRNVIRKKNALVTNYTKNARSYLSDIKKNGLNDVEDNRPIIVDETFSEKFNEGKQNENKNVPKLQLQCSICSYILYDRKKITEHVTKSHPKEKKIEFRVYEDDLKRVDKGNEEQKKPIEFLHLENKSKHNSSLGKKHIKGTIVDKKKENLMNVEQSDQQIEKTLKSESELFDKMQDKINPVFLHKHVPIENEKPIEVSDVTYFKQSKVNIPKTNVVASNNDEITIDKKSNKIVNYNEKNKSVTGLNDELLSNVLKKTAEISDCNIDVEKELPKSLENVFIQNRNEQVFSNFILEHQNIEEEIPAKKISKKQNKHIKRITSKTNNDYMFEDLESVIKSYSVCNTKKIKESLIKASEIATSEDNMKKLRVTENNIQVHTYINPYTEKNFSNKINNIQYRFDNELNTLDEALTTTIEYNEANLNKSDEQTKTITENLSNDKLKTPDEIDINKVNETRIKIGLKKLDNNLMEQLKKSLCKTPNTKKKKFFKQTNKNSEKIINVNLNHTNEENDEKFEVPSLENSLNRITINYMCMVCDKILKNTLAVLYHIRGKHFKTGAVTNLSFECLDCAAIYSSEEKLMDHSLSLHSHLIVQNKLVCRVLILDEGLCIKINCLICKNLFDGYSKYAEHMKLHAHSTFKKKCTETAKCIKKRNYVEDSKFKAECLHKCTESHDVDGLSDATLCETCGCLVSRKSLKYNVLTHSNYNFFCKICKKYFATYSLLTNHFKSHETQIQTHKKFRTRRMGFCNICRLTFFREVLLQNHRQTHHVYRKFWCYICQTYFPTRFHYFRHRSQHLKERLLLCNLCDKRFLNKRLFNQHLDFHTDTIIIN